MPQRLYNRDHQLIGQITGINSDPVAARVSGRCSSPTGAKAAWLRGALLTLLLALGCVCNAQAQKQKPVEPPNNFASKPIRPVGPVKPTPQERNMLDLPPLWINRVQGMTPVEQERFLGNNERFQSLPAERQAQIRRRLQAWNQLAPDQRQALLDRERVWQQMTPQQQRYVRDTLLPAWQNMAAARRQLVLRKLRNLRDLDESQRTARLNDELFLNGMSPEERSMLRDLSNLRVAAPEPLNE
jgi:hypothetical protein